MEFSGFKDTVRLFLIVLFLTSSGSTLSQNDKPPGTDKGKPGPNETQTRINGPVTIQGTVETINQPATTDEQQQRQQAANERRENAAVVIAGLTTLFAAAAFGAAMYQGIIARRALHMDQRAWVTVRKATLEGLGEAPLIVGEPLSIYIAIVNSGRTPALNKKRATTNVVA